MRTFVIGSNILRSAVRQLQTNGFELLGPTTPQSVVTSLGKPRLGTVHNAPSSRRERRLLREVFGPTVPDELARHQGDIDLVLWGFSDERSGVWSLSGSYLSLPGTPTSSVIDIGLPAQAKHLAFEESAFNELWHTSAARVAQAITHLGLERRVYVVDEPNATPASEWMSETVLGELPHARRLKIAFHSGDPGHPKQIAQALDARASTPKKLVPPQPLVTQAIDGTVNIHALPTPWSTSYALYVLEQGTVTEKADFQRSPHFKYTPHTPGQYRFRVYYANDAGDRISSESRAFTLS
ncbi:DUF6270 domain-containing protein [Cellulosimicrobium cellulans]|uniref:DUF6270 domain-containing protein n=1 Tax=Cellulosimicrobium cellulans TaxID=1710 RepID=UPI0038274901